ncbi:putative RNA polymerase II transcription factor [Naematelia encephala]|uniref:Putative RNA polymerase II transcription factor n=1 Tax=Naematelia encephala TaxID=71784 RepID=A0A1Y2AUA1_9TREE|nr:putative RNA polymerase II transcription factor [Naematelia encephala]
MTYILRDLTPVVAHVDSDAIRATYGVAEIFNRPRLTLPACYARPIGDDSEKSSWIVGDELAKTRSEARFEEKYQLQWPFRTSTSTVIEDWDGREYVLSHVYNLLDVRLSTNTAPLLLVLPDLTLEAQARYCQLAFEGLNVPGLSILPTPLAALYALGQTTGIVLHVGPRSSQISIVVDSVVRPECSTIVDVGSLDCEEFFEGLLKDDLKDLTEEEIKQLSKALYEEDVEIPAAKFGSRMPVNVETEEEAFDVAKRLVGDTAPKKKTKAPEVAADVVAITLPSRQVQVGPVRHRLCEPLLEGKAGGESVAEGMARALDSPTISLSERLAVYEGVAVIGDIAKVRSFGQALMTYLSPYLLSGSEPSSDVQPSKARLLSIPDYFANFKGATTDLAPFLGGSMVTKIAFSDQAGKHCVTKVDYNAKGPICIHTDKE